MNIKDYCNNLSVELGKWRDEIHKENEKINNYPSADKLHMKAVVDDLRMLEAEMDNRIDQLKNHCEIAWKPTNVDDTINPSGSF